MFVGKEMTDSASILSVGSNGFEFFFDRLAGLGLAAVGVTSGESLAVSSITSVSLSRDSGSGSSAPASHEWEAAMSATASTVDAIAQIPRVIE